MNTRITIGIIGNGFVGQATALLECENVQVMIYDIDESKRVPRDTTLESISKECDIVFVCVPTPMISPTNPRTNTSIVENVIKQLKDKELSRYCHIVVRSTVPTGFCKRLGVHHFPEFLTEKNWRNDFKEATEWIIGVNSVNDDIDNEEEVSDFKSKISNLFKFAHSSSCISSSNIIFESTDCTELAKYARNSFLAIKCSFFNELADFAEKKGIQYDNLVKLITLDSRINKSHTLIPGPDGQKGWGGTCFPKDTMSLLKQYEDVNTEGLVLKGGILRNEIDRPDKELVVGRSVS